VVAIAQSTQAPAVRRVKASHIVRTFRLDEANALLPKVSAMLGELLRTRRAAAVARLELGALQRESNVTERRQLALVRDVTALQERVITLIEEIHDLGCMVKDIDLGLIDFPSQAFGETINLCWKLGEPTIEFWHRMDEGFAWRKPLRELTL
jgi:hypothetical protein